MRWRTPRPGQAQRVGFEIFYRHETASNADFEILRVNIRYFYFAAVYLRNQSHFFIIAKLVINFNISGVSRY